MAHESGTGGSVYGSEEVIQLTRSWILISEDPVVGNDESDITSWASIQSHYEQAMNDFYKMNPGAVKLGDTSTSRLRSRWINVSRLCFCFSRAYNTMNDFGESGSTYKQRIERALALYQEEGNGEEFTYMGAWELLKDHQKWHHLCRMRCTEMGRKREVVTKRKMGSNESYGPKQAKGFRASDCRRKMPELQFDQDYTAIADALDEKGEATAELTAEIRRSTDDMLLTADKILQIANEVVQMVGEFSSSWARWVK